MRREPYERRAGQIRHLHLLLSRLQRYPGSPRNVPKMVPKMNLPSKRRNLAGTGFSAEEIHNESSVMYYDA